MFTVIYVVNSKWQSKNMAGEVVVDALPYIDQGYDEPGVREAVNTLNMCIRDIFHLYRKHKNK